MQRMFRLTISNVCNPAQEPYELSEIIQINI